MANIGVHDNILSLPIEIQLTILQYLNSRDLINIINSSNKFKELVQKFMPFFIRNYLEMYDYECIIWDNFDGTIDDFIKKLRIRDSSDDNNNIINNFIADCNRELHLNYTLPQNSNDVRKFKLYFFSLLSTNLDYIPCLIYTEQNYKTDGYINVYYEILTKYPQLVEIETEGESEGFADSIMELFAPLSYEEKQEFYEDVDKLIEIGARPSDAFEFCFDRNIEEDIEDKLQFIKNLKNGIISKYAFIITIDHIIPTEKDIELYHKFTNLFSHEVAYKLILQLENRNKNYDLTDEQIEKLSKLYVIHGDSCVYYFQY